MTENLYILTGASRGMGWAMAQQLLGAGNTLLCISRNASSQLAASAQKSGQNLMQWTHDLADAEGVSARLRDWLQSQDPTRFASATLINNAGVIPPVVPLRQSQPAALAQALRVGLEAPMALSAVFLGATQAWALPRKVLNISSGLGRYPMASQAGYCAAKAGMDHFTRCMALDEAHQPQGARVCSVSPGVIATDMQLQLRSAPAQDFPDRAGFVGLHAQGQLSSPEAAARRLLACLARADYGQEPVSDARG